MAISFDGKYLVTGGLDCMIKVWLLSTMKFVGDLKGHRAKIFVTPASPRAFASNPTHTSSAVWRETAA